ncbi:hypothetical protein EBR96_04755, partial [bacterium]|nr:hypothetical protein [bacterium]
MNRLQREVSGILRHSASICTMLFKMMIPISIAVKVLMELGIVRFLSPILAPAMASVGLAPELSVVWASAMLTGLYGGIVAFGTVGSTMILSIREATVIAAMMLLAHALPLEVRIAQRCGIRVPYMLFLRIGIAFLYAMLLNLILSQFPAFNQPATLFWHPEASHSILAWIHSELFTYGKIIVIVTGLLIFLRILEITGITKRMVQSAAPALRLLGIPPILAPISVVGLLLGLAYGGPLIIDELSKGHATPRQVAVTVSL